MIRFFITELPILPVSPDAPITATASGFMIRFMSRTMSSCFGRKRGAGGFQSTTMRTSAAVAPLSSANTGLRSISAISGKSATSCETLRITPASAARFTPLAPRTPFRISAAAMPSSIDSASSFDAGASRNVMSFITSTSTPPRPNATSLPNDGSVTAPMITSCPPPTICCTWTPASSALRLYFLALLMIVAKPFFTSAAFFTPTSTPPASVLCRICGDTILSTTG